MERGSELKGRSMTDVECYSLLIRVKSDLVLDVGRLGSMKFPAGYYVYTGRAKKGLSKRIQRHKMKKKQWHVDYLTSSFDATVEEVYYHAYPAEKECLVNQGFLNLPGACVPVPGFGNSDCRDSCSSHLIYFRKKPVCKVTHEI